MGEGEKAVRKTPWLELEKYRAQVTDYESNYNDAFGVFIIPYNGVKLRALACAGWISEQEHGREYAWDHVSVSLPNRCPNWLEMCHVKNLFWQDNETVLQLHPPEADYVNFHPNTLHLWKPLHLAVPLPPKGMV